MSTACCGQHKRLSRGLWVRSLIFLSLGILLFIPVIEALFVTGAPGMAFFAAVSVLMGYSVVKDFDQERGYSLGMLITLGMALSIPLVSGMLLQGILLGLSSVSFTSLLFIRQEVWRYLWLKLSYFLKRQKDNPERPSTLFELPSVNKIIIMSCFLNWGVSLGSYFNTAKIIYNFVLHDSLLTLGVFNMGAWVKQFFQTSTLSHNHLKKITTYNPITDQEEEKTVSALRRGMIIRVKDEILLPIKCKVLRKGCTIINDCSEKKESKINGDIIEKNTLYINGDIKCIEDYQPVNHNKQQKEANDSLLSVFLTLALGVAVTAGLVAGFSSSSIIAGFQKFCINSMVSCPCVFIILRPVLNSKILKWIKKEDSFEFNIMPNIGKPHIMVFDRTHTIYESNPSDPDGPYILNKGVKKLFHNLKQRGIEVYIISGHGTQDWQQHLKACQEELRGLVKPGNIIFDKRFHDPNVGAKQEIIENLQRYGQVSRPKNYSNNILSRLNYLFKRNVVGMVGDGSNDVAALRQADLSFCVSRDKNSLNDDVAQESNFFVQQKNLTGITGLIDVLDKGNKINNGFISISMICNVVLLALINGLLVSSFGIVLTPAVACLAISLFCIANVCAASLIKFNSKSTNINTQCKPSAVVSHSCCAPHTAGDLSSVCCSHHYHKQLQGVCSQGREHSPSIMSHSQLVSYRFT